MKKKSLSVSLATVKPGVWITCILMAVFMGCSAPNEAVVLKQINEVVVDATSGPMLKANAVFYNPNSQRMWLKKIDVDVFIDGKKVAEVDQDLSTLIPAKDEFSIPLEVRLAMKDLGFLDALFGIIGGKKMAIQYKGSIKLTYHGFPVRVPVDYKDEINLTF